MKSKVTQNDLIQYLYSETTTGKSEEIKKLLKSDISLKNQFKKVLKVKNEISNISFEPSQSTLYNIFKYAGIVNTVNKS